jgi:hypothetical protein
VRNEGTEGTDLIEIEVSSIELGVALPSRTFDLPLEVAALAP